ncbi:MAG: Gfo/Idh/MocA family protein [Rhizobiaceae bacterium]
MIKIGLCGYGYWGPILYRNFANSPHFDLVAIADRDGSRRERVRSSRPAIKYYDDASELIASPDIDAVAIATPVATHFALAAAAIQSGKHVFVEKPMCATAAEAEELVALADKAGVALMVDHTFLFTGSVRKIKELHASGELGRLSYFDSLRVNLGLFQSDTNVLWDLAPHDLSIMNFILEEEPIYVEATGYCHVNSHFPDIVYVTAHFQSDMIAHLNLSWMSPVKVRRIAVGGSKKMVVWDDLNQEEKIKIYNSGIDFRPEDQRLTITPSYRIGDVHSPRIGGEEAVAGAVAHFHGVITGHEQPIVDGRFGLRVVRQLEMCQTALDQSLATIDRLRGHSPERRVAR